MTMHGHIGLLLLRSCWKVKISLEWIGQRTPRFKSHRTCVGCFGETYCSTLTSSGEHSTTQTDDDCRMDTPTARNVAPAGSEYAETVRSNHCSEGRHIPY
ncbi:hypothetical protein TNCV_710241 [Trichonephila clavipes]|uniref:Secreted protein n=1 Tax=Trichonephila clavipes TaxID=2585209 RepID=A0A8X6V467_TRICX|nr:hypothetical protein TNCV_710241 [Trichonephila clavipes]